MSEGGSAAASPPRARRPGPVEARTGADIAGERPAIRRLEPVLVDRIAAGEVVERPAAALKELVENAIDAEATSIAITLEAGGRRLIRVVDDGIGMAADDLALAVERHATSKLPDGDLARIRTLGFRGEALPSIGAVARLDITTRAAGAGSGASITVEAGRKGPVRPAASARGTRIEVRDLFSATPARLKFLKSDRAEALAAADVVRRLAIARPGLRVTLCGDHLATATYAAEPDGADGFLSRAARVLGAEFAANACRVDAVRDGLSLLGDAGLPTFHRGSASHVHLVVNGRPVRDRLLLSAVRGAYADVMVRDRHPVAALRLDIDPELVDVNVHPAKTEVRFRDPGLVRSLVFSAVRDALARAGHRAATTGGTAALSRLGRSPLPPTPFGRPPSAAGFGEEGQATFTAFAAPNAPAVAGGDAADPAPEHPLGAARAQLHGTFIVSETRDGIVIIDQHAAHERLVYERLKAARAAEGVQRQVLLIPEVVELDGSDAARLAAEAAALAELGLVLEPFGPGAVILREIPAALAGAPLGRLVRDVADALAEDGVAGATLERRLDAVLSRISCHGSVRAGRRLAAAEMDALLRSMEETPLSGQCNHGRPTYVELKLAEIERLFGRR